MSDVGDQLTMGDALSQAERIRRGECTSVGLVSEAIDRIERFNRQLCSYVALDTDSALRAAKAADEYLGSAGPEALPPFHGVPTSIKDIIDVAGLPTTHSCKALANNMANLDDPLVTRLRRAGLVVLAKTNVPEFCSSMTTSELHGVCRNPWNVERTAGGSSGGAAAAVAARLCSVAHGTDGAGSVRVPASFCGLVGLKPSRRLVAFGPDQVNTYFGTSEPGVLSRSVRDAAALLDVMVGDQATEAGWSPRGTQSYREGLVQPLPRLKIAVSTTPPLGAITEACEGAAFQASQLLTSLGHSVEMATPEWDAIMVAAGGPMSVPGAAALVGPDQYDQLEPRNRPLVSRLATMTLVDHDQWARQTLAAAATFLRFWDRYDVLVTPTCGMVAPSVDWAPWDLSPEEHMALFASFPNFAQPFNLSGQPAISLPLYVDPDGLPIGIQLGGRLLDEGTILGLAAELERAAPWADRIAPDPAT